MSVNTHTHTYSLSTCTRIQSHHHTHTCTHTITCSEVPCMCLCLWDKLLIGGFTNGQIVVYSSESGAKLVEIAAHARSITAVDVAPKTGLVYYKKSDKETFASLLEIFLINRHRGRVCLIIYLSSTYCRIKGNC